jgi:hypothetical protein
MILTNFPKRNFLGKKKVIFLREEKSKTIPVTGRGGLYGCEMLRIPHSLDNRLTDGGKIVCLCERLV